MNLNQVTLVALDVAASIEFYRRLGFAPVVVAPHYARLAAPQGGATLSLHRVAGRPAASPTVVYLEAASRDELDALCARLAEQGVVFTQPPRDEPWLWREARLADPAGNPVCLYFAGAMRLHPPWRLPR